MRTLFKTSYDTDLTSSSTACRRSGIYRCSHHGAVPFVMDDFALAK